MAEATLKTKANKNQDQSKMENQTDPLNESFENISTSFPLIADGHYDLVCKEATLVKTNAGDPMLKLQLATTVPTTSRAGEDIPPGAVVFHNVTLRPTGDATARMINQNIGEVVQAAGITSAEMGAPKLSEQLDRLINGQWHLAFQGRVMRCTVGYKPAGVAKKTGKSYEAHNVITQFIKK